MMCHIFAAHVFGLVSDGPLRRQRCCTVDRLVVAPPTPQRRAGFECDVHHRRHCIGRLFGDYAGVVLHPNTPVATAAASADAAATVASVAERHAASLLLRCIERAAEAVRVGKTASSCIITNLRLVCERPVAAIVCVNARLRAAPVDTTIRRLNGQRDDVRGGIGGRPKRIAAACVLYHGSRCRYRCSACRRSISFTFSAFHH